ncbi:hypothetical protein ABC382_00015 [Lysinibacillus sp. 1P01SD]|uniref:hypothetical protein n=1 Tax=Lysinibacillus sp. 1P01SD TaxID=3132285 RepID=UPI0039A0EA55
MTTFDYKMKAVCIDNDNDIYIVDNMNKNLIFTFGVVCLSNYREENEHYISIGKIKSEIINNEIHNVSWDGFVKRDFSERYKKQYLFNLNLITRKLMSEFESYLKGKRIQQNELISELCRFLDQEIFNVNEMQKIVIRQLEEGDKLPLDAIYINLTGLTQESNTILSKMPLITNFNVLSGDSTYMKGLPSIKFDRDEMSFVLNENTGEQVIAYNPIKKEDELIIKYPKLERAVCFPIDYVHEFSSNFSDYFYPNGEAIICPVKVEKDGEIKKQLAVVKIRVNTFAFTTAIQDFKDILENSKCTEIMHLACLHSVQLFSTAIELSEWLQKNWSLCNLSVEDIELIREKIYTEKFDSLYAQSRLYYMRSEDAPHYKYIAEPLTVLQDMIKALYTEWCS